MRVFAFIAVSLLFADFFNCAFGKSYRPSPESNCNAERVQAPEPIASVDEYAKALEDLFHPGFECNLKIQCAAIYGKDNRYFPNHLSYPYRTLGAIKIRRNDCTATL